MLFPRLAPTTTSAAFFRATPGVVQEGLVEWYRELWRDVWLTPVEDVEGSVEGSLQAHLSPLIRGAFSKVVVVECEAGWTCVFNNALLGTDTGSASELARRLRLEFVSATLSRTVHRQGTTLWYGARQFCLEDHSQGREPRIRTLSVMNDGGRWTYFAEGRPLAHEDPDWLTPPRIRDRLPEEALTTLLAGLGIRMVDETFYRRVHSQIRLHVQAEEVQRSVAQAWFGLGAVEG